MAEQHPNAEQSFAREIGITERTVERRKSLAGFGPDDVGRIAAIKEVVTRHADEFTDAFFAFLAGVEEARPFVGNQAAMDQARRLKAEHLAAMVQGVYGLEYAEQRIKLGLLYSRSGLEPRVFLGAFQHLLGRIGATIMRQFERTPIDGFENFLSLQKIAMFDIALIVDVLASERERTIRQQQESIRELSAPVLQIRERLLLLPIIGMIDTLRARQITDGLLRAIRANRAKQVVMDVTGVATIDSRVANHLLQTVAAARLMGASVIITGISPPVAQSLVSLGIDLGKVNTVGDLQGGIDEADRQLGYRLLRPGESA